MSPGGGPGAFVAFDALQRRFVLLGPAGRAGSN
jgi:hypothetical protein